VIKGGVARVGSIGAAGGLGEIGRCCDYQYNVDYLLLLITYLATNASTVLSVKSYANFSPGIPINSSELTTPCQHVRVMFKTVVSCDGVSFCSVLLCQCVLCSARCCWCAEATSTTGPMYSVVPIACACDCYRCHHVYARSGVYGEGCDMTLLPSTALM